MLWRRPSFALLDPQPVFQDTLPLATSRHRGEEI